MTSLASCLNACSMHRVTASCSSPSWEVSSWAVWLEEGALSSFSVWQPGARARSVKRAANRRAIFFFIDLHLFSGERDRNPPLFQIYPILLTLYYNRPPPRQLTIFIENAQKLL